MRHIRLLLFSIITLFLSSVLMTSCKMKGEHITIGYGEHTDKEEHGTNKDTTRVDKSTRDSLTSVSSDIALNEHIVYYLDYSGSMEKDGLFNKVKDSLIKSIRNIKGENVEIEVIPFLDARLWDNGNPRSVFKITKGENFNEKELEKLCDSIRKLKALSKDSKGIWYKTHHNIVIKDFLNNRINNAKQYHLMVLLTDGADCSKSHSGADCSKSHSGADVLNESWLEKTNGKYVFGVYCDLQEGGTKKELAECFKNESHNHLFYKTDLNLDFDVSILANDDVTIYHRENPKAQIAIGGTIPKFTNTEQQDNHYKYTLTQPNNATYIEIRVDTLTPAKERPNSNDFAFKLEDENRTHTHYLSAREIKLRVIDIKTPIVKFWLPCETKDTGRCVSQKIDFCKKLFSCPPKWSDTITIKIAYEKSNDAKDKSELNGLKLSINDLPDYVKVIGASEVLLNKASDTVAFTLTTSPTSEELRDEDTISGKIMLTEADGLNEIFVNGKPLNEEVKSSYKLSWLKITTKKKWHPLLIIIIWLIISLIGLCLLACYIVWMHSILSLRFPQNGSLVVECIGDNSNIQFIGEGESGKVYNHEVIVPSGLSDRIFSEILNKYYIKEIIVKNKNQNFEFEKLSYWDKKWNGETIFINGEFYEYPISYLKIKPSGNREETDIEITVFDTNGNKDTTVKLPMHELSENKRRTKKLDLLKGKIQVYGDIPFKGQKTL